MPHHVIVRSGEVQWSDWNRRSDYIIADMLTKSLGIRRAVTMAWLEKIKGLASTWLINIDVYQHRSASRWLDLHSTLLDDVQSQTGRHCPHSNSTCGWWSEDNPIVSSQSGDEADEELPRPALPVLDHIDREIWISDWVSKIRAKKNKRAYRVINFFLLSRLEY
jgi:hypothetical protein